MKPVVHVIIPALNESLSIGHVVAAIQRDVVDEIIVVDNGSTDRTSVVAANAGATVIAENRKGYGNACLKGIAYCSNSVPTPDIIVFVDGDFSDFPEDIEMLIEPIREDRADLVIGSRTKGERAKGALTIQQIFGNWLATTMMKAMFGAHYTDLGPFRAIRFQSLLSLGMTDPTYGWTIEMQIKAAKKKLRFTEIPVRYRKRIGVSKISGTLKGTVLAGFKILYTLFKYV